MTLACGTDCFLMHTRGIWKPPEPHSSWHTIEQLTYIFDWAMGKTEKENLNTRACWERIGIHFQKRQKVLRNVGLELKQKTVSEKTFHFFGLKIIRNQSNSNKISIKKKWMLIFRFSCVNFANFKFWSGVTKLLWVRINDFFVVISFTFSRKLVPEYGLCRECSKRSEESAPWCKILLRRLTMLTLWHFLR